MPYLSDRFHDQNSGMAGTPGSNGSINRTGTFDSAAVTAAIGRRVLGQPLALEAVGHALVIAQAGIHDRERPLVSILLVGPTGVGKTELVRQLAAEIRNGPDDFCRIDMGQLAQEHYAASLTGAPPGYAGSRESSSLFDKTTIEGTPLTPGIVLFDEVEKAHSLVLRALLGALDHGRLTLANGEQTISFRNTLVFMTSNLGSAQVARQRTRPWRRAFDTIGRTPLFAIPADRAARLLSRRQATVVDRAVKTFFEPEFLNRLDGVVQFNEISPGIAADIVRLRLEDVLLRCRHRDVDLLIGDGVVERLVRAGFDPVNGARGLGRTVRQHMLVPIAHALVKHRRVNTAGSALRLRIDPSPGDVGDVLIVRRRAGDDQQRAVG